MRTTRLRRAPALLAVAALAGFGLVACGPKPAEQAGAAPVETSTMSASNAEAALDVAATPAAGTEAANVAAATDPGPPPANMADVREAAGDEGSIEAKAKVANAKEAGRFTPPKAAQ